MSIIDIRELALNVRAIVRGLNDGTTRHPLYVTDDGEPVAYVLRHQVYTPRLHRFAATYDDGFRCLDCEDTGTEWTTGRLDNLADFHQSANEHWRAVHYVRGEPLPGGTCRWPHPQSTWASCYLQHRHDGSHQSAAGIWPQED